MIGDKKPIALVFALGIKRNRLIGKSTSQNGGNELFTCLMWSKIVGTTRNTRMNAIRSHGSKNKQITSGLTRRIRRTWNERVGRSFTWLRIFKIAIHFISRNMKQANQRKGTNNIDQTLHTKHICLQKKRWIGNASINVAFCCKIHNRIDGILFKKTIQKSGIANIPLNKSNAILY